jgi:hypothetical protein
MSTDYRAMSGLRQKETNSIAAKSPEKMEALRKHGRWW